MSATSQLFLTGALLYMQDNLANLLAQEEALSQPGQGLVGGQVPPRLVNLTSVSSGMAQAAILKIQKDVLKAPELETAPFAAYAAKMLAPDSSLTREVARLGDYLSDVKKVADALENWEQCYKTATAAPYDKKLNEAMRQIEFRPLADALFRAGECENVYTLPQLIAMYRKRKGE